MHCTPVPCARKQWRQTLVHVTCQCLCQSCSVLLLLHGHFQVVWLLLLLLRVSLGCRLRDWSWWQMKTNLTEFSMETPGWPLILSALQFRTQFIVKQKKGICVFFSLASMGRSHRANVFVKVVLFHCCCMVIFKLSGCCCCCCRWVLAAD